MKFLVHNEIAKRVRQLDIPFNRYGYDKYGISRTHLEYFFSFLGFLYKKYLPVKSFGIEHIPKQGRGMLVGNHSGGVALDGGMVLASLLLEMEQPRLAQGMVDKFLADLPFASTWLSRIGQVTGLPEHAIRMLEDDRILMIFPEGHHGTAKLQSEQYSLVRFGTGFMRLALRTKSPIVPFAFVGGGDAIPSVMNLYSIAKLFGVPYIPVTPYLVPLPRPMPCELYYGEPMVFQGTGSEDDEVIEVYVEQVKAKIAELLEEGRRIREGVEKPQEALHPARPETTHAKAAKEGVRG